MLGISFVYGMSGSLYFNDIATKLIGNNSILLFAAALLYLTIIYKEGDHYGSSIRRT